MYKLILRFILLIPVYGFSQKGLNTEIDSLFCGNTKISFHHRCEKYLNYISFVHVHENETTAVKTANWFLDSLSEGCFVTWKSQNQRYINFTITNKTCQFDPNRIYTDTGIRKSLKLNGNQSDDAYLNVKRIANAFVEKYVDGKRLIIALHNNTNEGGLSIKSYVKGALYEKDASAVYINNNLDTDDFFYTTETKLFNYLKKRKYNVILQNSENVTDDGSLSVYCSQHKIPYINIEAQDGHYMQQKKMLMILREYIIENSNSL